MDDVQRQLDRLLISEPSVDAIDTWLESTAEEFPEITGQKPRVGNTGQNESPRVQRHEEPEGEFVDKLEKERRETRFREEGLRDILREEELREESLREAELREERQEESRRKELRQRLRQEIQDFSLQSQEGIGRDEMRKEMRNEELRLEEIRKEIRQEEVRRDLREKELREEEFKQEQIREELSQEELRQEQIRQKTLRHEQIRQKELRHEQSKRLRQEEIKNENIKHEELRQQLRQEELRRKEFRREFRPQLGFTQNEQQELSSEPYEPPKLRMEPQFTHFEQQKFRPEPEFTQYERSRPELEFTLYEQEELSPELEFGLESQPRQVVPEQEEFITDTSPTLESFCAHLDDYAQSDPVSEIRNLIMDPELPTPPDDILAALLQVARNVPRHKASLHPWTSALDELTQERMQQYTLRQESLRIQYANAVNAVAQRTQAEVMGQWKQAFRDVLICKALLNRWNVLVKKQFFVAWRLKALPSLNAAAQTKQILQIQLCKQLVSYWRHQLRARKMLEAQAAVLQRVNYTRILSSWRSQLSEVHQLDWHSVHDRHLRQLCYRQWKERLARLRDCEVHADNIVRKRVLTKWKEQRAILQAMPVWDHRLRDARRVLRIWRMQHQATSVQAQHVRNTGILLLRSWRARLYVAESRTLQFQEQLHAVILLWRHQTYQRAKVSTLLDRVIQVQDQAVAECILNIWKAQLAGLRGVSQKATDFYSNSVKRQSLIQLRRKHSNIGGMLNESISFYRRLLATEALKMMRDVYIQQRDERLKQKLEYAQLVVSMNVSAAVLSHWQQNLKRVERFCRIIDSSAARSTKQTILQVWHEALEANLRMKAQVPAVHDEWVKFKAMQTWKEAHNTVIELDTMANQQQLLYQALAGRNIVRKWHIQALKRVQLQDLAAARYSSNMKRIEVLVFHKWQQKTRPSLQLSTPRRSGGTPSTGIFTEMSPRLLKRLNTSNRRIEIYNSPRRSAGSDVSEVYTPTRGPRSTRSLGHDSLRLE